MTTAVLQFIAALCTLAFAAVAWRIARQAGDCSLSHAAWIVVAVAFLWRAIPETVQNAVAFWALHAGPGSDPYETFVRWTPAVNHARTLIMAALGWVLASLPLLRGRPMGFMWRWALAVAPLLAATGFFVGWREGPTSALHVASLSILGMVELVGLMVALQVALFLHSLDRYLWIFLCVYAVHVAIKVVWYSGAVEFFLGREWYPLAWVLPLLAIPPYLVGIVVSRRRLALARSGVPVPAIFEVDPRPLAWGPSRT